MFIVLLAAKRERERQEREAAIVLQKYARGWKMRKTFKVLLEKHRQLKALKEQMERERIERERKEQEERERQIQEEKERLQKEAREWENKNRLVENVSLIKWFSKITAEMIDFHLNCSLKFFT